MAKKSLVDKAGKKLQKISGIIGAIVVITGTLTGVYSWVSNQFKNAISVQISGFQDEVRAADKADKQAAARIELMVLMNHDPYNTVAIERMARYYFQELDGDQYMTKMYSDWCREYGGDVSIVVGGN